MDAQATVLAAERAAPKVVAARKEELDLEQRMQLVFEQEEMRQGQEQQSAARTKQMRVHVKVQLVVYGVEHKLWVSTVYPTTVTQQKSRLVPKK